MSDHTEKLPTDVQTEGAMAERFPRALDRLWPVKDYAGDPDRPGRCRANVFDHADGLRLIVSREGDAAAQFVHVSASFSADTATAGRVRDMLDARNQSVSAADRHRAAVTFLAAEAINLLRRFGAFRDDAVFTMAIKASGRAAHLFVEPAVFAALPPDTPAADVALVYGECPPDSQAVAGCPVPPESLRFVCPEFPYAPDAPRRHRARLAAVLADAVPITMTDASAVPLVAERCFDLHGGIRLVVNRVAVAGASDVYVHVVVCAAPGTRFARDVAQGPPTDDPVDAADARHAVMVEAALDALAAMTDFDRTVLDRDNWATDRFEGAVGIVLPPAAFPRLTGRRGRGGRRRWGGA